MNIRKWGFVFFSLAMISGCGETDSRKDDPIFQPLPVAPIEQPFVRIVFNPATADINIPNDLLMVPSSNLFDFTINSENDNEFNQSNPLDALGAIDGWSTNYPFSIRVTLPDGMDIDPGTVNESSIKIFEATQALEGTEALCQAIASASPAPGVPCVLGQELQYGVDFVASYTPGSAAISVVPLKPFKGAQGHVMVVTESLKATDGRPVKGSGTWDLVRQDIQTNRLGVEQLVPLQEIINAIVNILEPTGIEREDISYAAYFSTRSVGNVYSTIKQLQIGPFAQALQSAISSGVDLASAQQLAKQFLPGISTSLPTAKGNAFEVLAPLVFPAEQTAQLTSLGLNTCQGLIGALSDQTSPLFPIASQTFAIAGPFCAAKRIDGDLKLPFYSDPNDIQNDWWSAACTNGAMLQALGSEAVVGLIQAGAVGPNNGLCQAASNGQLFDLNLSSLGINDPRFLTKVNPIPVAKGRNADDPQTLYNEAGTEDIKVQFTVPDESVIAVVSAATNGAIPVISKPEAGWPVVIFQHGLGGNKENALAMSAALSLAGFASAAIDHSLHGDRGLITHDGRLLNASVNGSADYFSGGKLLTGRDRSRQSVADILGFRLALNAISDSTGLIELDLSKVHFIGQSLGAIAGTPAVSQANSELPGSLSAFNSMYRFNTAVLNVPAAGSATSIFESPSFGPSFKSAILFAGSEGFAQFVSSYAATNQLGVGDALIPAFNAFIDSADEATLATVNQTLSAYAYVSQTISDDADTINYGELIASNTPTMVQLVVGGGTNDDGSVALTDQVNPVNTSLPLAGGQALADIIGLPKVSTSSSGNGVVRITVGSHSSLLDPASSAAATAEMQSQAISFFLSNGQSIVVTNEDIVEN